MNKTIEYIGNKYSVDVSAPIVRLTQVNRTMLASLFSELGFTTGAEIGVAEGHYSKVLLDANPNLTLHLVDPWKTYEGFYEDKNLEKMYEMVQEKLKPYKTVYHRKKSMEAVEEFPDNSLDFVFIDAMHDFKHTAEDICEWSKKVKPGGIIFGHDYKFHKTYVQKYGNGRTKLRHAIEVKIVVDAYRDARAIKPWFEIYSEVNDPNFGRDNPCFLFVRQDGDLV